MIAEVDRLGEQAFERHVELYGGGTAAGQIAADLVAHA